MAETKENVAGVAAEAPVKKARRGVSNDIQATSQLRFHEKDAAPNGLFIAHLHSVAVQWSTNADGKQFTGERVPRLTFEFCSNTKDAAQMRHVSHSLFPVESNVNTIPGGTEEWKVNQVLNFIKHMLDVYYLKGRKLTEEEEDALSLPFVDFDDEGNFVSIDVKDVLAGYAQLFNNVADIMNGRFNLPDGETPKPCFRDEDGKYIRCWIKLIRHKKVKGEWRNVGQNGELAFDPFIGNGLVEIAKGNELPKIVNYDPSRESINPQEVKKAPTIPGSLNMNGGVMVGGPAMLGAPTGGAYSEAAEEMPF